MSVALSTVQEKGLSPRNVKRSVVRVNPIDFDTSVAVGIDLPFGSPTSGDYGTITSGSAKEVPEIQKDQAISTTRKTGGVFNLNYTTEDQTSANIRNLVLTSPGERPFHLNFGVGVYELLFDNVNDDTLDALESTIETQVGYWLPHVKLRDVYVTQAPNNEHEVAINISYTVYANADPANVEILV